jgi:ketosteroid isomerase-like protein
MGSQRTIDEADIRQRIEAGVAAGRAEDLEGVMALYAPDVVSFDVGSPLRSAGAEAKRRAWLEVFAMYQRPIRYEVRDLDITVGDDVAFGHSVNRIGAVLKNGDTIGFWLRWTTCFAKINGNWLIVHDHVSVPVDPQTRTALLELSP